MLHGVTLFSQQELRQVPEDIYVFDESFLWSIVFTHETGTDGKKWCIFAYNKELALNTDNN